MGNFKLYLFLAILALFIIMPIVKSGIQEASIGQDIRRIKLEYSMHGREAFRARLDEIVINAPLDPKDVKIQIEERRPQGNVLIEIRYVSRMQILFFPFDRQVVVRQEIPLVPL